MANIKRNPRGGRRFHDACVFFRAWIRDPRRIGSLTPSSDALADLITAEIVQASAPVIELGAGTGVFTRALLTRGVPEDRLVLVEREPNLARILQLRFPTARIFCADAARIGRVGLLGSESAGAVVSGLPLLNLPMRTVIAILDSSFRHMRPGAAFYQFTYGPRCPVSRNILDRFGLRAKRLDATFANLPPATVYRIRRRLEHWPDNAGKVNSDPNRYAHELTKQRKVCGPQISLKFSSWETKIEIPVTAISSPQLYRTPVLSAFVSSNPTLRENGLQLCGRNK